MAKCPYNKSIECDETYRGKELRRQLYITAMGHGFWVRPARNGCEVQPWMCACLAAGQKQR